MASRIPRHWAQNHRRGTQGEAVRFMNPWNDTSIEWKDTSVLPEAGLMVLIHIPGDFEPIWFGFWDGRQWHYVEGLAVRAKVWHWCEIPKPPTEKLGGWQAAEVPPALITAA